MENKNNYEKVNILFGYYQKNLLVTYDTYFDRI